jgi:hypothetical protein
MTLKRTRPTRGLHSPVPLVLLLIQIVVIFQETACFTVLLPPSRKKTTAVSSSHEAYRDNKRLVHRRSAIYYDTPTSTIFRRIPKSSSSSSLPVHGLTTALESLWEERVQQQHDESEGVVSDYYQHLTWIDLDADGDGDDFRDDDNDDDGYNIHQIMPLYPLPAVYVPTHGSVNHTLVNIEPQNVKMALDLLREAAAAAASTKSKSGEADKIIDIQNVVNDDVEYSGSGGQFCVVLRAIDSGRVASVGTVLTILDADIQLHYQPMMNRNGDNNRNSNSNDNNDDDEQKTTTRTTTEDHPYSDYKIDDIARIRLTCRADSLVKIINIENPEAFSPTNRIIYRSDEYLRAKVRPFVSIISGAESEIESSSSDSLLSSKSTTTTTMMKVSDLATTMNSILKDYSTIKTIYQLELGSEDFPPGWLAELGKNMPTSFDLHPDDDDNDDSDDNSTSIDIDSFEGMFWRFVQEWQSVCLTLRQGQYAVVSTERNELMIDAASAKGGPLKLPIHVEDLDQETRLEIQNLEWQAQEKYLRRQMDPVLDFQVMISLPTWSDRIQWLSIMVTRERKRLEDIASSRY